MNSLKLRRIILAAIFAAAICVTTGYILHIPVGNGYIHPGDGIIYLAASILPAPYALAAAAIGGGLADTLTGYYIYIIPTVLIKPVNALCFSNKGDKILTRRNLIGGVISGFVTAIGYYIAAAILFDSWAGALSTIPGNFIQAGFSITLYYILGFALDKRGLTLR